MRGGVVSNRLVVVVLTCIWILAPIVPIYTMVHALVDPPENREQRSRNNVPLALQGDVHIVYLYKITQITKKLSLTRWQKDMFVASKRLA